MNANTTTVSTAPSASLSMAEPGSWLSRGLSLHHTSQARLIGTVRALRRELSGEIGPVKSPGLPIAPLEVPDRITKRDYNYFNALNAALETLTGANHGPAGHE
jgi:hypothetical protein